MIGGVQFGSNDGQYEGSEEIRDTAVWLGVCLLIFFMGMVVIDHFLFLFRSGF